MTGRNVEADSVAAVVLEADTGRVVAMASQPTDDPGAFVGGIGKRELDRLYSEAAGTPLLGRTTSRLRILPGINRHPRCPLL